MSAACRFCYAEAWAKRTGHDVWGEGGERRLFGDKHWSEPLRWNRKAEAAGVPLRVFCASMADVFEDHPELPPQRERLWELIGRTPWLTWQLLTKRPQNIAGMVPWVDDWPPNVWVGTTVEDQASAALRIPDLLAVNPVVRFLSCEPLLGPLELDLNGIGWVIGGGESGAKARPSHPNWFRSLRDQCMEAGVPFLFKQWGEWLPGTVTSVDCAGFGDILYPDNGRCDDNPLNRVAWQFDGYGGTSREADFGDGWVAIKIGKKAAGRFLDSRTWDGLPALAVPA